MKSSSRASNFVLDPVANSACSQPELTPALPTSMRTTCSTICRVAFLHGCRAPSPSPRAARLPTPPNTNARAPERQHAPSCARPGSRSRSGRTRAEPPWPPPPSSRAELVAATAGLLRPNRARHHHLQLEPPLLRPFPGHRGRRSVVPPEVLRAWPPAPKARPPRVVSGQATGIGGCTW